MLATYSRIFCLEPRAAIQVAPAFPFFTSPSIYSRTHANKTTTGNGYKKQSASHLEQSLLNLSWSEAHNPHWATESSDEKAILAMLRAVVLRNLRRHDESKSQLQGVLSADPTIFKGQFMDDWPAPVAHYEMAVNLWMERAGYINIYGTGIVSVGVSVGGADFTSKELSKEEISHDARLVAEAKRFIEKAKGWGAYALDARIGMKVTAAGDAVRSWEKRFAGK